jgi:hypothetical protein
VERQQDGGGKEGSMADLETGTPKLVVENLWYFLGLWSWVLEERKKTVFLFYFILIMFKIAIMVIF